MSVNNYKIIIILKKMSINKNSILIFYKYIMQISWKKKSKHVKINCL